MEKWMCLGSVGVAALMLILFVADIAAGFPFSGDMSDSPFLLVDIGGALAAVIVGYLGWNAYRDVK